MTVEQTTSPGRLRCPRPHTLAVSAIRPKNLPSTSGQSEEAPRPLPARGDDRGAPVAALSEIPIEEIG